MWKPSDALAAIWGALRFAGIGFWRLISCNASAPLVAGVVKLLEAGEAVAATAAHLASLARIGELPPSPPCR
jgi:hypothetical protein